MLQEDDNEEHEKKLKIHENNTDRTLDAIESVIDEIDIQLNPYDVIKLDDIQAFREQDAANNAENLKIKLVMASLKTALQSNNKE